MASCVHQIVSLLHGKFITLDSEQDSFMDSISNIHKSKLWP